jgi:hypothetical protein
MPLRSLRARHYLVAAGLLVLALLLVPQRAQADVGIESIKPSAGTAGDAVEVTVGCGFCFPPCSASARARAATCMPSQHALPPGKYSFPILLVPINRRLAPRRCGADALCGPTSVGVPRRPPFTYLGRASPASSRSDLEQPRGIPRYRLRFHIPAVKPGVYQLVIYSAGWGRRGTLVADVHRWQLRVHSSDAVSSQGEGPGMSAWIGGATVAVAGALLALWALRRRAGTNGRAVRARSTSR